MRTIYLVLLSLCTLTASASTINVQLGTAGLFAVLAGSTVTNTGLTLVQGDLGVWPGTSITGIPPGTVTGTIHDSDAVAQQAQADLTSAYNFALSQPCNGSLTGQDLGGLVLTPGVYCFSSSAQLTGSLILDSQGDPNAVFIFQIGSTLTTASGSSISFANGGQGNVYWQVGSSATVGTSTAFTGNILALTSITLNTGATIDCGRALASNGAVTMDTNDVSFGTGACSSGGVVPEPGTTSFISLGLLGMVLCGSRLRKRAVSASPSDGLGR